MSLPSSSNAGHEAGVKLGLEGRVRRSRRAAWLGLALALGAHLWEARALQPQIDDAYISYRYARNLAEGHGLVFNPGERVEGMTNLSWTLALAAAEASGIPSPQAAHVFGVVSGAAFLLLAWLWVRDRVRAERAWLAGAAVLVVWSSNVFGAWVVSGLETPLFAALALAAFHAQARGRIGWATVAVILATYTRPDGVVIAAALYAAQLWPWRGAPLAVFQRFERWGPPVLYALSVLVLTAFRLAYYGSVVPNTFYAKVGDIPIARGGFYVASFLFDGAIWLVVPIGIGVWAMQRGVAAAGERLPLRPHAGHGLLLLLTVYAVYVGGDVFKHGRFLWPALPLLLGTACIGIDAAFDRGRERGWLLLVFLCAAGVWPLWGSHWLPAVGAALAVVGCAQPGLRERAPWAPAVAGALGLALVVVCAQGRARSPRSAVDPASKLAAMQAAEDSWLGSRKRTTAKFPNFLIDATVRRQVKFVKQAKPSAQLVAHTAIGRFGYWSGVPILDLLGLVDAHIARAVPSEQPLSEVLAGAEPRAPRRLILPGHQRSDPDYVFARRPDFIFIGNHSEKRRSVGLPAVLDLWDDPRLDRDYHWVPRLMAYERNDRAAAAPSGATGAPGDGRMPEWREDRSD